MPGGYDPHHCACKDSVNETARGVWKASRSVASPLRERLLRLVGATEARPNGAKRCLSRCTSC